MAGSVLPARAAPGRQAKAVSGESVQVVVVVTPELDLELEDRRQVRLSGILVPPAWSEAAAEWLRRASAGRMLDLRPHGTDRHGALLVDLLDDGRSLTEALLEAGHGFARPEALDKRTAKRLLAAEDLARAAGRGIWADPGLGGLDAENVAADPQVFAVVRGRALAVARQQRFLYINFGADQRRDFTVRIDTGDLARFRRAGLDPMVLQGRSLRVRGWLFRSGGPMIEVTEPTQIEVLNCEGKTCADR